jgi:hypothetical protein
MTPPLRHQLVQRVSFSPDGSLLFTGGQHGRVWDAATGEPLSLPLDGRFAAAMSPDGRRVATLGYHGLRLWDLSPGDRPTTDLVEWAQLLSGHKFDPTGNLVSLEPAALGRLWEGYRSRYLGRPGNIVPLPGPALQAPPPGAVLENGTLDRSKKVVWEFRWAEVPGATQYHLCIWSPRFKVPLFNFPDLTAPTYRHQHDEPYGNVMGWRRWRVRALVRGIWTDWSEERTFDVAPLKAGQPASPGK